MCLPTCLVSDTPVPFHTQTRFFSYLSDFRFLLSGRATICLISANYSIITTNFPYQTLPHSPSLSLSRSHFIITPFNVHAFFLFPLPPPLSFSLFLSYSPSSYKQLNIFIYYTYRNDYVNILWQIIIINNNLIIVSRGKSVKLRVAINVPTWFFFRLIMDISLISLYCIRYRCTYCIVTVTELPFLGIGR